MSQLLIPLVFRVNRDSRTTLSHPHNTMTHHPTRVSRFINRKSPHCPWPWPDPPRPLCRLGLQRSSPILQETQTPVGRIWVFTVTFDRWWMTRDVVHYNQMWSMCNNVLMTRHRKFRTNHLNLMKLIFFCPLFFFVLGWNVSKTLK